MKATTVRNGFPDVAPPMTRVTRGDLLTQGARCSGPQPVGRVSHNRLTNWLDGTGLGHPRWTPGGPGLAENRLRRTGRTFGTRLRIRRLGVRVPPSAPRPQARCPPGSGLFRRPRSHGGSHGHTSAAEQSPAHRLSRRPLVAFEQVPVHVLGDGDAGMPEHLRDHVQAACPGPASERLPSGAARADASDPGPPARTAARRSARSYQGPSASRPRWRRSARDPATAFRPPSESRPAAPGVAGTWPPSRE